jgi:hypothetical protein
MTFIELTNEEVKSLRETDRNAYNRYMCKRRYHLNKEFRERKILKAKERYCNLKNQNIRPSTKFVILTKDELKILSEKLQECI